MKARVSNCPVVMNLQPRFRLPATAWVVAAWYFGWAAVPALGDDQVGVDAVATVFSRQDALIAALTIFVLAIFVGFEVITKVPPTLHTPLMSGSNAISGITLVGALIVAGQADRASLLGVFAVVFAMINVVGGFMVTHRMLSMFQKRK